MIPLPPQKFIDAVAGGPVHSAGHVEVGRQLHTLVKERCCVLPEDAVLDLGCGCGRIAVHFTASQRGEYHGLDIMNPMVEWCRAQITTRFPNFHFHHADLENTLYRGGTENAATFKFPFSDSKFNVVFATSLFTHLLPDSATNYAQEIARVLRPGGRALLTFFLLNSDWRERIASGQKLLAEFPYKIGDCRTANLENPEAVIAYEQHDAVKIFEDAGLDVDSISLGAWRKRSDGWTWQDAILVSKPA